MANKKQNKNSGNTLFFLFAVISVFFILLLISAMVGSRQAAFDNGKKDSPDSLVAKSGRSLEVLAINQGGYTARDTNTGEQAMVIAPPATEIQFFNGAIVKVGDILVLEKYVAAANGLVAQKMQVLPPVPLDKPTLSLPSNPNE